MKKITMYLFVFFLSAMTWQTMAQLTEDFEGGFVNLTNAASNDLDFALETTLFHGGAQSVKNAYASSQTNVLEQAVAMDLSATTTPFLEFWHIAKTEGNYDKCYVEISTDGGATYAALLSAEYLGSGDYASTYFDEDSYADWGTSSSTVIDNTKWKKETFDLSAYKVANVKIRFRLASDGSVNREGWYIDDVQVSEAPTCLTPTAMTDANLAFTSVDLSWAAGGSAETMWEVVYNVAPYAMPADGVADASGEPGYMQVTPNATASLSSLTDNTTYDVYYRADCGAGDYSDWASYSFTTNALPPGNDDCGNPTSVPVNADLSCANVVSGTIAGATDSGVSDNGAGTPNDDVWFTFVAAADTHQISMTNVAGDYTDLIHEVLSGDCATLVSLNVSDPDTSTVGGLTIGDTYYIRVFGWSATAGRDTTFDVCVGTLPPPPANNDFANAEMLTVNATCTNTLGTIISATASGMAGIDTSCGSTDGTEADVWYSFMAPVDGNITITTSVGTGANLDTVMGLYSYDGTAITSLDCNDDGAGIAPFSEIVIADGSLVAGDIYYVQIHEYDGNNVDDFNICVVGIPEPTCGVPSNLSAVVANSYADLAWDAGADGETMWDFEVGAVGFTVDTGASALRIDDLTENPVQIAGFTPGTDYEFYVRAVCSATLSSDWVGPFAFTTTAVVPANDLCGAATALTVGISRNDNQVFDSNSMATDSGETAPSCASYGGADLWYSAVVPASGRIYFETFSGFGGDGGLAVYSGSCGALTEIACSDDEGLGLYGLIELEGQTPGDTLYARVWEYGGDATINFTIVAYSPTCNVPTNFAATTTTTTADITWDAGTDGETMWDFEYGSTGFTQGTGTMQTEITTNAPNALTGLTQSTTYDYYVRAVCTSGVSTSDWVGPMSFTTAPSNDDCATPDTLTVYASGMSAGNETAANSSGATESAQGQTSCDSVGTNLDMFYEFTVPAGEDTIYVLTGGATGANIELVLFDVCGGTEIAGTCMDQFTPHILTGLTAGTTYLLQVWHDSFNAGEFTIALESAPTCPTPMAMADANLTDVSVDLSWTAGDAETMWEVVYDVDPYVMPANGMADASGEPGYTSVSTTPALSLSMLTPSTTYQVYYRAICSPGDVSDWVSFTFTTPAPPPANDLAANAIAVACGDTVTGDTSSATIDPQGDCGSVDNDAPNVFYTFTGTGTAEDVTLSLCNSGYDTSIAVFTGTPGALVCYANNDDGCGLQSEVTFTSDGIQTYYIMIEGFNVGSTGAYEMVVSCAAACTPAVTNQDCGSADALTLGVTTSSDTTCATGNINNPSCDTFGVIKDVWFTVQATSDQLNITTTLGTATDVNVAVYEGTCGALAEVVGACADTAATANGLNLTGLTSGDTYYIQVWNAGGAEEGTFDITVVDPVIATGTLESVGFRYFPNPVTNNLQLQANENIKSIAVFNMLGQEVISARPSALETSLNMANLASGTYFVKAQVGDAIGTFKIVKK